MTFSISDASGNTQTTSVDFFVDTIYFNVSAASLDLEVPTPETLVSGDIELTLTVRTVGAGFRVVMIRGSPFLSSSGTSLPDRTGSSGIAYKLSPYTSPLDAFQTEATVMDIPPEQTPDGQLHEHQASLKLAAVIDGQQSAESYISSLSFRIEIDYTDRSTCIFANSHFACHL